MTNRGRAGVVLVVAAVGAGFWLRPYVDRAVGTSVTASPSEARHYQCSMHPQVVSDRPGTCPICRMPLTPVGEVPPARGRERTVIGYRHPMRPDVTSPTPAVDEMGMPYTPIYADETDGEVAVPGHAAFTLSPERQQLIGVTREVVGRRKLALAIRAVGRVAYDPKLYEALIEYRQALRARRELERSPWEEAHTGASSLARAATLKLRQLGLSDDVLAAFARAEGGASSLLLPGQSVWIYVQVPEAESALVHAGQPMSVTSAAHPGRRWSTTVTGVDPILDPTTRSARVRALVATPEGDLRPETFVDATIEVPLGEQLAVPLGAVLDTGARTLVFVVSGAGRFTPRVVELGRTAQGYAEVLGGLTPGEEVVTSANFLIDSESRFRAAVAGFAAEDHLR